MLIGKSTKRHNYQKQLFEEWQKICAGW